MTVNLFTGPLDLVERICTVAGKPDNCNTYDNSIHIGSKKLYPTFDNYEGQASYRIFITLIHRAYVNVDVCVSLPWSENVEHELHNTSNAGYDLAYFRTFKNVLPILKKHEKDLVIHEVRVNTQNKQLQEAVAQYART